MLTASLQSTWDSQKNRQGGRQKYGTYQNGYSASEDADNNKTGYLSQGGTLGRSSNYSAQQAQQNLSYHGNSPAGNHVSELPGLKMAQVGGTRGHLNVGSTLSSQHAGSGLSPRGGNPSQSHFGGGGISNGFPSGGLSGGNSLFLGQHHQQQHQLTQGNGGQLGHTTGGLGMGGSGGLRKHRASSRQSNHKGSRRHQSSRYAESPNYNPPHGGGMNNEGGMNTVGGGNKYGSHQQHHAQSNGLGHACGVSPAFMQPQQQYAPSPNSTLLMNTGGPGDSAAAYHHGHAQQSSHLLPHIAGTGNNASGALSSGILPPTGAKHSGSSSLRNQYLSGGNTHSSPPSPTLNLGHGGSVAAGGAGAIPVYNVSTAPVVREFQSGNVLTGTEEHGHCAVTTIRGMKPGNPNWTNQDNFFVTENFDGRDIRIYCVLDGHGEHGHLVSRRCREMFPQFIKSARLDMDGAFNMMQNDLNSASDMDVRCSGATCVMATLFGGRISVYNCGDSRAVLGRRNPNGSIYATALSKDHKPDKAEERKRILSCGGHLGCRQVLVNQPGRGPVSMPVGPCRVWYQHRGETLGLAMSRSLGDSIVHKSGVSAEPELMERVIDDYDEFLILATDGVWDVVDNNYAVQLVQSFAAKSANWSPIEASNSICKFARSRWEKLSPMIDDITCIVVKIHR